MFQSFLLAVYSPPGRPLEKKELGLVSVSPSVCRVGLHTCHSVSPLLSLSPWSQHLPQCQSTSVSVALVSTLATVSVHSVLKCFSHCPCGYTDGTTDWKHSYWLPTALSKFMFISPSTDRGWTRILWWTRVSRHYNNFLSGFAVRNECDRARVAGFLPHLGLPVNSVEGRGAEVTDLASLRLVD